MKKRLLPNSLTSACLIALCAVLAFAMPSATAQDWAKPMLDKSPRHQEWVKVTYGSRTVDAFVVYPEVSHKAPVVLLIHEIFGLTDWARSMADDIAAMGYIVIAPDLLSGFGPNGGGTSAFPDMQATMKAVSGLDPGDRNRRPERRGRLRAEVSRGQRQARRRGLLLGRRQDRFDFATQRKDLSAAFVFYGPPPPTEALARITAPVYGFYGGNDARITATVPATKDAMAAAGKKYDPVDLRRRRAWIHARRRRPGEHESGQCDGASGGIEAAGGAAEGPVGSSPKTAFTSPSSTIRTRA